MTPKSREYLKRLDQAAERLNVWLLMIALGLGMMTLMVGIAKLAPPANPVIHREQDGRTQTDRGTDLPQLQAPRDAP